MGLLNKKAFRDLFGNRKRILMTFLAMVLGTTVFGTFTFTRELINREIEAEYSATVPASASILVDRIDDNLLHLLERYNGISGFETGATHELMLEKTDGTIKKVQLFSSPSYIERKINIVTFVEGSFTPSLGEVLIDSDAMGVAGAKMGDRIALRLPDDSMREYVISGLVNDLSQHPPSVHDEVYAYVSPETLSDMGLGMNRIDYLVSKNLYDRVHILDSSQALIYFLQNEGYEIGAIHVSNTPGISMHREEYKGALFIIQVFSVVAFLFGCIIMSSLFSTILAGQVKQIGVLKSLGAKTANIIRAYMGVTFVLILCNIMVSLPLSYLAARGLSSFFMSLGNMMIANFAIPDYLLVIFCAAGVLVPFALALIPIHRGLSVTVKEAINSLGIKVRRVKKAQLTGMLERRIERPILFSLRSAMENRRRFGMNVAMLTLGGLMFVGIMGSIISINAALSNSINAHLYDYQIVTSLYTDEKTITKAVAGQENIAQYEVWGTTSGQIKYSGGNTGNTFAFSAPLSNTKLYRPNLIQGRWLNERDTNAIVVSYKFFEQEPGYALGSRVSFQFVDWVKEFEIVGVINEIGHGTIYMNQAGYEQLIPQYARRSSINIVSEYTGGRKSEMYRNISEYVLENGVPVLQAITKSDKQEILTAHFNTTLTAFLVVAILSVIVAGFGLATTMSLQVLERTQEIGVLKSIGANDRQVFSMITAESTFTCLFGFGLCFILGIPFTALAIQVIGVSILQIPMSMSPLAIAVALAIWLVVTLLIGRIASNQAAKRAVRLTVKEALTIELSVILQK